MTKDELDRLADEYASSVTEKYDYGEHISMDWARIADAFDSGYRARDAEVQRLEAERDGARKLLEPLENMVPRSRLQATEQEIADAEAKTLKVQESARAEIERLQAEAAAMQTGLRHVQYLQTVMEHYREAGKEKIAICKIATPIKMASEAPASAGQALLDRLRKLEDVVEAARAFIDETQERSKAAGKNEMLYPEGYVALLESLVELKRLAALEGR